MTEVRALPPEREPLVTLTHTTLAMRLMACGFRFLFRAFARVRTSGLEQLPQHGPLIVVANHTTLVDPPFVAAWLQPALGRPLQFLAKEQLFTPALSPILRMYGAIVVKAGGSDVEAYRAAVTVLRNDGVVVALPGGHAQPRRGHDRTTCRDRPHRCQDRRADPAGRDLGWASIPAVGPYAAGLRQPADHAGRPAVQRRARSCPRSARGDGGRHRRDHAAHRCPRRCRAAWSLRRAARG